jgi:hypothetical protein
MPETMGRQAAVSLRLDPHQPAEDLAAANPAVEGGAAARRPAAHAGASSTQHVHGGTFQIEMAGARSIARMALIGLGTTTHGFDMGSHVPPSFPRPAGCSRSVRMSCRAYSASEIAGLAR